MEIQQRVETDSGVIRCCGWNSCNANGLLDFKCVSTVDCLEP